jgi:hypothetical protein
MQSSFGHVVRAAVMLACLALVPALAIYGKQLQEFGRVVWETYQARTHAKAAETSEAPSNAPPWPAPPAGSTTDHLSPTNGWPSGTAAGEPQRLPANWDQTNPLPAGLAGNRTPTGAAQASEVQQASFTGSGGPDHSAGNVRSVAGDLPAAGNRGAGEGESAGANPTASQGAGSGASCTVEFRRIEQRLRELGATYYLLETWGRTGDRYRFLCRMALTGNSNYGADRIFLATDSDPLRAMENVLQQAEQWRAGRPQ